MPKDSHLIEVFMSMMPDSGHQLIYDNGIYLEDNFQPIASFPTDYSDQSGHPIKFAFTLVILMRGGHGRMRVNLRDYELGPDDIFIIPEGSIMDRAERDADSRFAIIACSKYDYPFIMNTNIFPGYQWEVLNDVLLVHVPHATMEGILDTYSLIRRVITDSHLTSKGVILSGYFSAIANWLLVEIEENKKRAQQRQHTREEEVFAEFLTNVRHHYAKERSVSFYASLACLSSKYFGLMILKVSKRRAIDWISDFVILDAKTMILSGDYTIQQISDALSFPSTSFFCRYFREHVGCSPKTFAEQSSRQ